jgi:hypothetical protein
MIRYFIENEVIAPYAVTRKKPNSNQWIVF